MKISELVGKLSKCDPDAEVMILDGFNGSGTPRELNLGPSEHVITESDGHEADDCQRLVGHKVIVLGYGCY